MQRFADIRYRLSPLPCPPFLLKLSGQFFRPALDDYFFLGEELDCVHALTMQVTKEWFLLPAERVESHQRCHAAIFHEVFDNSQVYLVGFRNCFKLLCLFPSCVNTLLVYTAKFKWLMSLQLMI